jgi:hypothetical protein
MKLSKKNKEILFDVALNVGLTFAMIAIGTVFIAVEKAKELKKYAK